MYKLVYWVLQGYGYVGISTGRLQYVSLSRGIQAYKRINWTIYDCIGLSRDISGYVKLSRGIKGYNRLPNGIKIFLGYVTACRNTLGCIQ